MLTLYADILCGFVARFVAKMGRCAFSSTKMDGFIGGLPALRLSL